jgi:hypothetical protein
MSHLASDEIKQKQAEIGECQKRLDWHARRGRPGGTVDHDIMLRLIRELSELMEAQNGKQNLEGHDSETGRLDRSGGRPDSLLQ